ncbi:hypothetical protein [Paenibacillus lutrae]|uniref:Uncharacterized protein n=1 Tax=Paenibacillus lutrae TaxID=2078573 RepID=A0A7X3FEE1_9BACL|nr:hypothetical protein [Paenibacillus lutrae]MVO97946.1 hypothetical protein [Paenibacillus lutrae]
MTAWRECPAWKLDMLQSLARSQRALSRLLESAAVAVPALQRHDAGSDSVRANFQSEQKRKFVKTSQKRDHAAGPENSHRVKHSMSASGGRRQERQERNAASGEAAASKTGNVRETQVNAAKRGSRAGTDAGKNRMAAGISAAECQNPVERNASGGRQQQAAPRAKGEEAVLPPEALLLRLAAYHYVLLRKIDLLLPPRRHTSQTPAAPWLQGGVCAGSSGKRRRRA